MSDKLRMDAYYYGFEETGCKEIDLILSAVACAGKAYHHTDDWMDETRPYPPHEGQCPVDWIQNAAEKAAVLIKEFEAERDAAVLAEREACAQVIEKNTCPCRPVHLNTWTDEDLNAYKAGQIDAASSFIYAIRSRSNKGLEK